MRSLTAMTRLAELTTIRLGGPAARLVTAHDERQAIEAVSAARGAVLVLAGGSNVVIADDGFPGTVVHFVSRGVDVRDHGASALVTVAAGEPWDAVVERCVSCGLAGVECLSGIPGSTGATPIQNVGAYGQDVSQTIVSVRAYDRASGTLVSLPPSECGFSYRSSRFKRDRERWLVLSVTFRLPRQSDSMPVAYTELARELEIEAGAAAPLRAVRAAVLRIRARKGMVVDPADPESVSVGSFFTNPILDAAEFEALSARAGGRPPRFPEPDGRVKTSAAWLVEHAGFEHGYGPGPVHISARHTLALVNRGDGTAAGLVGLAAEIARGVHDAFGVSLVPEPVLVGIDWGEELSNRREPATRPLAQG
jgi:UDP-N-acetylmuramate dehydrogenase